MAIVSLAVNGVGLGHLVRATCVCEALLTVGERPVVFSQGLFPLHDGSTVPGKQIPSLWRANTSQRRRVASEIASIARISRPSVLIEDTHPNPLDLPPDIRRVLLVRPTTFDYLLELERVYGALYDSFLLCDDPVSPTWPYTGAETETLSSWRHWQCIGPIYRGATEVQRAEVRSRYRLDERKLCVFTMGGGGVHAAADRDAERFVERAEAIASSLMSLDPDARLLFVRGLYFPQDLHLDEPFEEVQREHLMPALLAEAHAAVVRTGYNTLWECIAAGTPFVPFIGTTFEEPNDERLQRLRDRGLVQGALSLLWQDEPWRLGYKESCSRIVARHPGLPDPVALRSLIVGPKRPRRAPRVTRVIRDSHPGGTARRPALRESSLQRQLVIRVDDVVSLDRTVVWLLSTLAARGLKASIDVIPYLCAIDESIFSSVDPESRLEVAQHGYAHIPRSDDTGRRFEFDPRAVLPSASDLVQIEVGMSTLRTMFPTRFSGGFSAPFDALPSWLPGSWHAMGGTFVSHLFGDDRPNAPVPLVSAGADIWDWKRSRMRTRTDLEGALKTQLLAHGRVGIVLHPQCLRREHDRRGLVALLDELERSRFSTVSLRELALARS